MDLPRPILWGSELSPFALKLRALLGYAQLPYDWLPSNGSRLRNYRVAMRVERAKRTRAALRYPWTSPLDEYPLVPYLVAADRVYYDSSAIACWLDDHHPPPGGALVPHDPFLGFIVRLVDEAFDEIVERAQAGRIGEGDGVAQNVVVDGVHAWES